MREGVFSFEDRIWSTISADAKDFITQLLTYDMTARPSAAVCLQHRWLTELANSAVEESLAISALDNLQGFKADVTLKQATYAFIASQLLGKSERDSLAKVFKAFDKNGDGKLSIDEVKEGYLEHYGKIMSDEEVV